jgi:hypothetical protein
MAKKITHQGNKEVRASVRKAFRENRRPEQTRRVQSPYVRPLTSRLIKGQTVLMAKTNQEAEDDLSLDIAETVGKTVGNIVNRIETLDKERAELIKKLADARSALNEQFNKWIPESIAAVGASVKSKAKREAKPGEPCKICGFATDPAHDGRKHRAQETKKPFTSDELEAAGMVRVTP